MNWPIALCGMFLAGIISSAITSTRYEMKSTLPEIERFDRRLVDKPFAISNATIYEFRNSQGGTCILALRGIGNNYPLAIACMKQLPSMDFENLPRAQ